MKNKTKELDVDFIGEQNNPLTKKEEKAISDFILANKEKLKLKKTIKKATAKRKEKQLA